MVSGRESDSARVLRAQRAVHTVRRRAHPLSEFRVTVCSARICPGGRGVRLRFDRLGRAELDWAGIVDSERRLPLPRPHSQPLPPRATDRFESMAVEIVRWEGQQKLSFGDAGGTAAAGLGYGPGPRAGRKRNGWARQSEPESAGSAAGAGTGSSPLKGPGRIRAARAKELCSPPPRSRIPA
jgi:hypothetical protein